jgi:alkylation response protein AidB-like acyl-CoA dehydrogenase
MSVCLSVWLSTHHPFYLLIVIFHFQAAAPEIAMIKVVAPAMAQNVTDRAIQVTLAALHSSGRRHKPRSTAHQ